MNETQSHAQFVARRGELMAELFLQDLGPEFIARPTSELPYDLFVGFSNGRGGLNVTAVQVEATERAADGRFAVPRARYDRWANSNIPVLLLVIDVKHNKYYYAWPGKDGSPPPKAGDKIAVPLTAFEEKAKEQLRVLLAA